MATVSSVASMGYSSSSASSIRKELNDAKSEYNDLSKNKNLTSEERQTMQKEYKDKIASLSDKLSTAEDEALASIGSTASSMFGGSNTDTLSLFGSSAANGQSGFDFFFGASNTLSNLSVVNKARQGIENRARVLTAEIKMDRMRGINTSGKEEALSNLTGNLTMMNSNLTNNVNKALTAEDSEKADYKPIITSIKDQLTDNQKKLDTEFKDRLDKTKEKYGIIDEGNE